MVLSGHIDDISWTTPLIRFNLFSCRNKLLPVYHFLFARLNLSIFYLLLIQVRAAVIGLGAGLLPMFLHGAMPFMQVEVIITFKS